MKYIEVWADWHFMTEPKRVGVLDAASTRGKEIFSFTYDSDWLNTPPSGTHPLQIDPKLQLYSGKFYIDDEQKNFGVFLDSSPDRWGRTLMLRREALLAKQESRAPRALMESDYLLGVYDKTRMGALRFKFPGGAFLDHQSGHPTPPWMSLRELEQASLFLEADHSEDEPKFSEQHKLLFAPGYSLGGARPKSSVLATDESLWIAKFPSLGDLNDVGGWEIMAWELAKQCQLNVPLAKAQKFASRHHTFLVKRFDRTNSGRRIHFVSAMTLLERKDGDGFQSGASYLEIADWIIQNGAPEFVNNDLEELWRRIVFSISVSNSDDHLRNHGFLLTESGWRLSPAYDINPNELADGLSLNISQDSNALDFELALSVAEDFRIDLAPAKAILTETQKVISTWPAVATRYGIPRSEQQRMGKAFKVG
jgi:serine/threonine-protein kinase HipA